MTQYQVLWFIIARCDDQVTSNASSSWTILTAVCQDHQTSVLDHLLHFAEIYMTLCHMYKRLCCFVAMSKLRLSSAQRQVCEDDVAACKPITDTHSELTVIVLVRIRLA